jgi:hypothetical protein
VRLVVAIDPNHEVGWPDCSHPSSPAAFTPTVTGRTVTFQSAVGERSVGRGGVRGRHAGGGTRLKPTWVLAVSSHRGADGNVVENLVAVQASEPMNAPETGRNFTVVLSQHCQNFA